MTIDLKIQYGYIVYPYNDQSKQIFLKDRYVTRYIVKRKQKEERKEENKENYKTETSPQNLSEEFRTFLENKGYEITSVKKTYFCGIDEICGNRIDVNKLLDENKEIKSLLIRIHGIDDFDLEQKIQTIREFVKSKFGIESDMSNKFMFSKTNRC